MSFKKFVLIPTFTGVLAFILQMFDQSFAPMLQPMGNHGFAWISFQAWAVYFFAGCNLKGGVKAYINYIMGIFAAIFIILFGQALGPWGYFAMPTSLLVACVIFLSLERVELFNLLPPMFISAGLFFGFITYVPGANFVNTGVAIAFYAFVGLFLGYITILFRTWYEGKVSKST
jgi:hypothetical protein